MTALQSDRNGGYERLRAWYLAHLRKSQLVGEVAGGMTPATLIKRDRQALEQLIAKDETSQSSPVETKFKLQPQDLLIGANAVAGGWILFERSIPIEFSVRFAIAVLLILSSLFLGKLARRLTESDNSLKAVTQREKDIADYAYEAFWSLSEDCKIVACSRALESLAGNPGYVLSGRSFLQLAPTEEKQNLEDFFEKVKRAGQPQICETQIARAEQVFVDLELTAEYSASDSIFYCLAKDISARKNVERLKEQLMDMLSHDLKTPLASLQFALTLLATDGHGSLNEKGQGLLKTSDKNINRLLSLITQMLELHKLDSEQLSLTLEDVPVAHIIQAALEVIESFAEEKQMEITVVADEIVVRADKYRMLQVLVNLLSNAIKYSPSGSEVVLTVKKLPGDWLAEFRVSDAGAGILQEHRQRVFDRFYRVASDASSEQEGTGLGLAICKMIVEAHGGRIDVEANSPKGSSFYCHIPMVKAKAV